MNSTKSSTEERIEAKEERILNSLSANTIFKLGARQSEAMRAMREATAVEFPELADSGMILLAGGRRGRK